MAQHDPAVFRIAGSWMEHPTGKAPGLPRIVGVDEGVGLIRLHLRRDHNRGRRVEERYAVSDGGHVPIGEGDQTPGCDRYLFARGRFPEDLPVERSGLHVEPALVSQEIRIGQPERLVIDEQLDDLAVGYAQDRLAGSRKAVGSLHVYDRVGFIVSVDESGVFGVGATFLRSSTHAEISIAERQHRLQLSQQFGVKPFFNDVPFIGWEIVDWRPVGYMMDHRAVLLWRCARARLSRELFLRLRQK